jgi:hypothetical protein
MVAPQQWRIGFDVAYGTFETSHVAECPEVAPECATTFIPPHEHHVQLRLAHYDLIADYGIRHNMQLSLRLPYDVKAMRVRYSTLDGAPFTPPYGDIHHRTETLTGISDPSLTLESSPHEQWLFGLGTTLPFGHIEADPIALGAAGKTHEHIQFGSGTFQPLITAQFANAHFVARAEAKLSLYENREGFRAPQNLSWSFGPTFRAGIFSIDPRLNGQHQTVGKWNGEADEGTGFDNGGVRLQLSMPAGAFTIAPSVYRELWSHGAHDETFHQGTTWGLALIRTF